MLLPGFLLRGSIWYVALLFGMMQQENQVALSQVLDAPNYMLDQWQADEGLPHSAVTTIFQGQDGYLWIGTGVGLVRFDGIRFVNVFEQQAPFLADSYVWSISQDKSGILWVGSSNGLVKFKNHQVETYTTEHGLPNNFVRSIMHDMEGRLWVGTYGGGICLFDTNTDTCHQIAEHDGQDDQFVNTIIQDRQGVIWVGTDAGLLLWQNDQWTDVVGKDEMQDQVKALTQDEEGRIWIGTSSGVYLRTNSGELNAVLSEGDPIQAVRSFWEDRDGNLWVGTESSGLYKFSSGVLTHFDVDWELTNNYIYDVFQDEEGSIWVGTNGGGLNRLKMKRVQVYGLPEGLPDNIVNSLLEDRDGAFWFGTSNGLARLEDQEITLFDEDKGLVSDRVLSLAEDQEGGIWIGTNGGGLSRWYNGAFESITSQDGLLSDVVFSTMVDSKGALWVGTTRGLNRIDAGQVTAYTAEEGLPNGFAVVIREGLQDDLWIGTDAGLAYFREGEFRIYTEQDGLPNNAIRALFFDSLGTLWVGTRGGLGRLVGDRFESFTTDQGLPDNVIYHVDADNTGNLWLNTGRSGVLRIPIHQFDELVSGSRAQVSPLSLDRSDGMRSIDGIGGFQPAGLKDRRGRLWFLTHSGAVVVNPNEIAPDPYQMPVHIEEVIADSSLLIPQEGSITIPYGTNRVTIRYAGLSYLNSNRLLFSTQLEGLEEYWSYEVNEGGYGRTREFSRLAPGAYTFRVRGANRDGVWSSNEAELRIVVPFPWWRSYWAIGGYFIFLGMSIYGIVRWRVVALERRNKELEVVITQRTQQISQQAQRLEDMDMLKSKFFANISHELRTPLTLILGSTEEMRERKMEDSTLRFVDIIENQGRQLLNLVSQLLDLSRIDAGAVELVLVRSNLVPFVQKIVSSFMPLAERRSISLELQFSSPNITTEYDEEKLQQVIYNVLSNAFKHTGQSGKVHVSLDASSTSAFILIRDTGSGIEHEDLPYIFDRFYQGTTPAASGGTSSGIGLALAKELIEMHKGAISVESTPGFGSVFRIQLPLKTDTEHELTLSSKGAPNTYPLNYQQLDSFEVEQQDQDGAAKPVILFIEDNPEVRAFVAMSLSEHFQIIEMASGKDALSHLSRDLPDLILSDVMMAGMNGFELSQQLRSDERYKHIPIILLTAQASAESMEKGLNMGVDDYVTKPFNAKHLRLRIQNAIASRSVLREKYSRELVVKPSNVSIESADELFLRRAMEIVEEKMGETTFRVDSLAAELGLSRRQLQRKFRDTSNISPSEFIRNMRLERAAQLLESEAGTVSEIAFKVGFNKPSHFSELFRKKFGKSPTEYRT